MTGRDQIVVLIGIMLSAFCAMLVLVYAGYSLMEWLTK